VNHIKKLESVVFFKKVKTERNMAQKKKYIKRKRKKKELTYERKAIELAREHWEKEKHKSIKDRRSFFGSTDYSHCELLRRIPWPYTRRKQLEKIWF
jgi:hypothetical protein